jgi:N-formylglutamate amidohydrolase
MTPLSPPLIHHQRGDLPVLLSVPHSGRDYPDWLIESASAGRSALTTLEDPLVDRAVEGPMGLVEAIAELVRADRTAP